MLSLRIYYIPTKGRKLDSATQRNMLDWDNNMKWPTNAVHESST